jgi:hypothetical protein
MQFMPLLYENLPGAPPAGELLADRGHDGDRFPVGLISRGIAPCIPSTSSRNVGLPRDKTVYRQWHRIESAFGLGRLKH